MTKHLGAPDVGISDDHTLAMLRVALLLLVPIFVAMLMFWAR